jgi:D-3-phosphoglycerate dehydrogenase
MTEGYSKLESMTILVADTFEHSGLDALRTAGCAVLYEPGLGEAALPERLRSSGARVLVVRSTKVTAAALDAGALALVVRAGAGYNTIDVAAAAARGIYVSNCPGRNAVAVAELTMGLILALDRRIPENTADLKAGRWNKKEFSTARGLAGRTLGLLGYGHIGREVARRAHAFGMPIVVWSRRFADADRRNDSSDAGVPLQFAVSPADAASRADVLSVHLALAPGTARMVDASVLGGLKAGSFFINTARAELVDSEALRDAVVNRGVRAALDVFDDEPDASGPFTNALAPLPGVIGTHHIGASTAQAQEAIAAETVRVVLSFKDTGQVPNVVNLATRTPATHMLIVRHRDRPGVLAHVFEQLRLGGVNVQETENVIFEGAVAAVARINMDGAPEGARIDAIRSGHPDIIEVSVVPL